MVKSYRRVGERETKTKAGPTYEFIEGKRSVKVEGVSDASAIHYSLWIMFSIKVKSVLFCTHSYGRYVRLMIPSGEVINARALDVAPLRMRNGIYIE